MKMRMLNAEGELDADGADTRAKFKPSYFLVIVTFYSIYVISNTLLKMKTNYFKYFTHV